MVYTGYKRLGNMCPHQRGDLISDIGFNGVGHIQELGPADRRCTGKSSLVVTTSSAFQPMMDTPPNTEDNMTMTLSVFSWSGITQINSELSPDTTREKTWGRERRERERGGKEGGKEGGREGGRKEGMSKGGEGGREKG